MTYNVFGGTLSLTQSIIRVENEIVDYRGKWKITQ